MNIKLTQEQEFLLVKIRLGLKKLTRAELEDKFIELFDAWLRTKNFLRQDTLGDNE